MILTDVNVLIYAHREDAADHRRFRDWMEKVVAGPEAFGVCDFVLSGFLRVVTHPKIFHPPTPLPRAIEFCEFLRDQPNAVVITPGDRHWEIFTAFCAKAHARGDLIADAFLAALAVESGCEWITTDRDYSRFPGLRWRHPF
ncbi:MAG: type II toxin-antitoxin system VapC family toxin [Acidobacteria bacterium]|nr:type II toxin-antitoxin system VapC family toxin [Acidobacteriota bacterium]MBV9071045.1 type II toxin-antitoxin system VapC family toxin [Acidobacteriota bacterium]MBV9185021.1 type II toxin-antitoxin system VapC family toxin [Acidobacteriota bacterium]